MRTKPSRDRGAIAVEALILIPLFTLIWALVFYVFFVGRAHIAVQRPPRQAVWAVAEKVSCGNYTSPIVQNISLDSQDQFLDDRQTIADKLSFLEPTLLTTAMGTSVLGTQMGRVARPRLIGGGSDQIHGVHAMACATPTDEWEYDDVFKKTCDELLQEWCP